MPDEPSPTAALIAKLRAADNARLADIARERDQARTNIEQGQQMIAQAQTALLGCNGAEIAVKQHLADLDAEEKTDA